MSDRVKIKISVEPIEQLTTENNTTKDVLASEVNRNLGSSGTVEVTDFSGDANVQGYADAAVNYREVLDSVDFVDISSETAAKVVFIKNTGFTYSSATSLGAALDKSIKVMVGSTMISILTSGEAITLSDVNGGLDCTTIHVRTVDNDGSNNTGAGHLAAEFLASK